MAAMCRVYVCDGFGVSTTENRPLDSDLCVDVGERGDGWSEQCWGRCRAVTDGDIRADVGSKGT